MHAVLCCGVSPQWLEAASSRGYATGERHTPTRITEALEKMRSDFQSYTATQFKSYMLDPDDSDNWNTFVMLLQSHKWDAVTCGGGVRTIPELGDLFTKFVDQVRKQQPQAILVFPLVPDSIVPELRKWLPEAK